MSCRQFLDDQSTLIWSDPWILGLDSFRPLLVRRLVRIICLTGFAPSFRLVPVSEIVILFSIFLMQSRSRKFSKCLFALMAVLIPACGLLILSGISRSNLYTMCCSLLWIPTFPLLVWKIGKAYGSLEFMHASVFFFGN